MRKFEKMFRLAWENHAKAYSSHDWERDQEAWVKAWTVDEVCETLKKVGGTRNQIRRAIRSLDDHADYLTHCGCGWSADVHYAAADMLRQYLGKSIPPEQWLREWNIWTLDPWTTAGSGLPWVKTAQEAVVLADRKPGWMMAKIRAHLARCARANWSSTYAGWDGVPYQYDNGPWPAQDRFYRFDDGVMGLIYCKDGESRAYADA